MASIAWSKGGEASLLEVNGDSVRLRSTIPSPPGSRLEGALSAEGVTIKVKVHSSRRQDDGSFQLEGRLLDATREVKSVLGRCLSR